MVQFVILKSTIVTRLYLNLTAHVGPGRANNDDDVQLVQLGYFSMLQNPDTELAAEEREIYLQITPGDAYKGGLNEPLTKAIKIHQSRRGGTQDGVVSPIKSTDGFYPDSSGGAKTYMLAALVNNIFDVHPGIYPRLDLSGNCPPALKASIIRLTSLAKTKG